MSIPHDDRLHRTFLLVLVVAISCAFVFMIRDFLLVIVLAAVFAGLCHPIYRRLLRLMRGRAVAASLATLSLLIAVVAGPVATLGSLLVAQAVAVSENMGPKVEALFQERAALDRYLEYLPFAEQILPYKAQIIAKTGEIIASVGSAVVNSITGTIGTTVVFLLQLVIFLYTLFFLLIDGRAMLDRALAYVPLPASHKRAMVDTFVSVARATLKGTILIGIAQGVLSGLAFWAVGIEGAVFWGTLMTALSIIPGVGAALVWVPASLMLALGGSPVRALLLAAFCAVVVGSIDNILRPRLVGRDTHLHELFIFFSTIGGLIVFGPMGFILGPIVAALFVTVWEIYGRTFEDEIGEGAASPR